MNFCLPDLFGFFFRDFFYLAIFHQPMQFVVFYLWQLSPGDIPFCLKESMLSTALGFPLLIMYRCLLLEVFSQGLLPP